jgi:hypothetical protein
LRRAMAKPNQSEEARQEQKRHFIEYFEQVPVIKYASYYVEITEQTALNWLKNDPEFLNRVNQAKARWAKKRALQTKAEFQLERLDKEIWREQKDFVTDGEPFTALVEFVGERKKDD